MDEPHYYMYTYEASGLDNNAVFTARAVGDLDCDGVYSTFELVGRVSSDGRFMGEDAFYIDQEDE